MLSEIADSDEKDTDGEVPADPHRLAAMPKLFLGAWPMIGVDLEQMPEALIRRGVPASSAAIFAADDAVSEPAAMLTRGDVETETPGAPAGANTVVDEPILARRTFAGLPDQVGAARRWLSRMIDGFAAVDDVLLACSELAANAIMHSDSGLPGGVFTVRLAISSEFIRLEVLDQGGPWNGRSDRFARGDEHAQDASQCGRGLVVIAAITDAWGIVGDQQGRTAWCEIRSE